MGTRDDRDHFRTYRPQTRAKHAIVSDYLSPYVDILKRLNKRLVYIDAFAGAGYYEDENGTPQPGSPIRAMELIQAKPGFGGIVRCIFSEPDSHNFKALTRAVDSFRKDNPDSPEPLVVQLKFAELVEALRRQYGQDLQQMAPSLLFVDPCGISGASMNALSTVLSRTYSEAIVFFNSSGLARVMGAGVHEPVADLYGSEDVASDLISEFQQVQGAQEREWLMLRTYEERLRRVCRATHICSFRFEHEDREATSHYLIHASKHPIAFAIMKDIMWSRGSGEYLELRQASARDGQTRLFSAGDDEVDKEIRSCLEGGPREVGYFKALAEEPQNRIAPKQYKTRLLALEQRGVVEVLRDGELAPASSRRRLKGMPTLADQCEVRLSG